MVQEPESSGDRLPQAARRAGEAESKEQHFSDGCEIGGEDRPRWSKNRTAASVRKAAQRLKTITGRVVRQLDAALPKESRDRRLVETAKKILSQKHSETGKIYSMHEPEAYWMSKGKEHKKYEF